VQNRSLSVNSIGGRAPLPAAAVIIQNEKDGKSTSERASERERVLVAAERTMRVEEAAAVAQAPAHVWAEYFSHVLLNESLRVKFSHLDANFWTKSHTQFIFSGQNLYVFFY
jgi:hypothetical protein